MTDGPAKTDNVRTARRVDRRLAVDVKVGDRTFTTFTRNISLGGAFIESSEKLVFGTRVKLRITVPTQKEPIDADGQVRWSDESGFGVQFDGLRARDVWALGKLLDRPE